MRSIFYQTLAAALLTLQAFCSIGKAQAEDTPPVFELDCINFAGRGLANAPVKKKPHPGLAVDGTIWSIGPDKRVLITKVFEAEAAAKAGVEQGDEIVSINGYATEGAQLADLFYAYHMYNPNTLMESLVVKGKDGTNKTLKLQLLTVDKCDPEEKRAWQDLYRCWGY